VHRAAVRRSRRINDINLMSFDFPGWTTNKCAWPAQAPPNANENSQGWAEAPSLCGQEK